MIRGSNNGTPRRRTSSSDYESNNNNNSNGGMYFGYYGNSNSASTGSLAGRSSGNTSPSNSYSSSSSSSSISSPVLGPSRPQPSQSAVTASAAGSSSASASAWTMMDTLLDHNDHDHVNDSNSNSNRSLPPPNLPQHERHDQQHQLLLNSIPYQGQGVSAGASTPKTSTAPPPVTPTTSGALRLHSHVNNVVHSISEDYSEEEEEDEEIDNTDDEWLDQERQYYAGSTPIQHQHQHSSSGGVGGNRMSDNDSLASSAGSSNGGRRRSDSRSPALLKSSFSHQSFEGDTATAMPVFPHYNNPSHNHHGMMSSGASSIRSAPAPIRSGRMMNAIKSAAPRRLVFDTYSTNQARPATPTKILSNTSAAVVSSPRNSGHQRPVRTLSTPSAMGPVAGTDMLTLSPGPSSSSGWNSSRTILPPYHQAAAAAAAAAAADGSRSSSALPPVFQQPHGRQNNVVVRKTNPLIFSALMGFAFIGVFWYTQSYATLHNALEQVTVMSEERRLVHLQFRDVERDILRLQRKLFEIDQGTTGAAGGTLTVDEGVDKKKKKNGDDSDLIESESYRRTTNQGENSPSSELVKEMVALQERLSESNTQIGSLQHHLQKTSRIDAERKYGSGAIRVQLELDFPEDYMDGGNDDQQRQAPTHHLQQSKNKEKMKKKKPTKMVLEMAPLDLMPHSVNMFLDMVHAGLFDGCSFVLVAMQMIKLAPLPYDGSSASAKVRSFKQRGLETIAFKEYSPDFPHDQYTVAFAADGGPSFYINTEDNTEAHVGEPCFAKIVSGFDTLERLSNEPTRANIWYRRRIGVKHATIL
mmetsp:Transcript_2707/g.5839  ORF Transcript_2707/g.5839 Transcript_2707/m.5839 type:complete len:809 (+) Transcript_2707:266-2692(+)